MKKILLVIASALAGAALAAVPGTYTARDYVQSGLVAHWDGREYCAYDVHPLTCRYWVDLIGRRNVYLNNWQTYTDDGISFSGNSTQHAYSYCGDLSCFDPSDDGVTVEVTVTLTSTTRTGGILTAPLGSGIAIFQSQANITLASGDKGAQSALSSFVTGAPQFVRLSVGYRNGEVDDEHLFCDGVPISRDESKKLTGPTADNLLHVCKGGNSQGQGTYHSIRVYNRLLTAEEVAKNAEIDRCRYLGEPCFEVVSGSVTVDGVTYAAGAKVYALRGQAAEITAATDAVIRPVADGSARLAVTGCSVALEPVAADEMTYVESLALGADAVLALPATGLGLNAAALTADVSASVTGSGLLVSAAATCPVTLADGVTYRTAGGSFEGWPTSGVAYVPVGATPTIAAASDVAGLSAIVFLDDGTDAADQTTVSCTAAEQVTLSAKVNGPGVIAAASGGGLKVTGDNAKFRGNFDLSGVDVEVSNEYGLGSSVSRATKIVRGATSKLVFDNGASVFTNYAKLWINNADNNSYRVIGSASADKKLVQAETLEFGSPVGNNWYVYLDYNIDLLKGYRTLETSAAIHPRLSAKNPGECHIYGELCQNQSGHGFLQRSNVHFHQASYKTDRMVQGGEPFVCEATDVFVSGSYQPNALGLTLDLNGFDQHFTYLAYYNNANAAETGDPTHIIASETPARIIVTGGAYTERPKFTGFAGFEHASALTNVFCGVESTSKGELRVSSGALVLRNGYSWVGDVSVRGGRLVLDSAMALGGGKGVLTVDGGVLELKSGAGCAVSKVVCGTGVVTEPGEYSVADLQALGMSVEGPDDVRVKVVKSYDGEWTGWPDEEGATALVPNNTTVIVEDEDVAKIAKLGKLELGNGARVVYENGSESLTLKAEVSGFGSLEFINCPDTVLACDSSKLESPGHYLISNTCVTVRNRYGLGSASSGTAFVYCGEKANILTFEGEGLTNDVPLQVWLGTGANGGLVLGSTVEGEVFVQNAGLRLMTGSSLTFRNYVRFSNGTITYEAGKAAAIHFYPGFAKDALAKEVWLDAGSVLDAGSRRCFVSGGIWHLDGDWTSGQIHPDGNACFVCERENALSGRTFSPYSGSTLDLNGLDQGGLIWAPEHDGSHVGSCVTSAVPAKVTITACSFDTKYDTYAVAYRGEAGLRYEPTSGKGRTTTFVNLFSDTMGQLDVAKETLVFADGAGWGGTNVTVRAGATLQVEATSAATAFKPAGRATGRTDLVIEQGGTLNLVGTDDVVCRSLVYDGNPVAPGRYTQSSSVGVAGAGTLVVRKLPGKHGLSLIVR